MTTMIYRQQQQHPAETLIATTTWVTSTTVMRQHQRTTPVHLFIHHITSARTIRQVFITPCSVGTKDHGTTPATWSRSNHTTDKIRRNILLSSVVSIHFYSYNMYHIGMTLSITFIIIYIFSIILFYLQGTILCYVVYK